MSAGRRPDSDHARRRSPERSKELALRKYIDEAARDCYTALAEVGGRAWGVDLAQRVGLSEHGLRRILEQRPERFRIGHAKDEERNHRVAMVVEIRVSPPQRTPPPLPPLLATAGNSVQDLPCHGP